MAAAQSNHEPDGEADEKRQEIGQIRDVHDLRDDRGQAGTVKTDINIA